MLDRQEIKYPRQGLIGHLFDFVALAPQFVMRVERSCMGHDNMCPDLSRGSQMRKQAVS
jgi:hypothetical protein